MPALLPATVRIAVVPLVLFGCTPRSEPDPKPGSDPSPDTAPVQPREDAQPPADPVEVPAGCAAGVPFPAPPPATGAEVDPFVAGVEARTGVTVPQWWRDALGSARPLEAGGAAYDLAVRAGGDRRGEMITRESGFHTRPTVDATTQEDGAVLLRNLRNELRLPATELWPTNAETPAWIDVVASADLFHVAVFEAGSGGFPFEVRAFSKETGERAWTTTVCSVNRTMLGGLGYLIVQLKRREQRLYVFSAESHGVALDVLDAETGAVLAQSIDGHWGLPQASTSG